jgi:hypothetical protein
MFIDPVLLTVVMLIFVIAIIYAAVGQGKADRRAEAARLAARKLKVLKKDLINVGAETLIEHNINNYAEDSRIAHQKCDAITDAVAAVTDAQDYKVIVQALFEGGFLSTGDSDFSCEMLLNRVYGVKAYHALDTFLELHERLIFEGMNGGDNKYNPSGDNYYYAYEFDQRPDEIELSIVNSESSREKRAPDDKGYREDVKRKVIVVENQSPAYAYILESSIFSGEPRKLYFVQLMQNYNDDLGLDELLACEFDIGDLHEWSAYKDTTPRRILTTLNIEHMECKPIVTPMHIEYMLFNLYSGQCGAEIDFKDNV